MQEQENERLKKIDEKLAQLKAQKQAIINREKKKQRAERTRRLIQLGAITEKYIGIENISPEELENLFYDLVKHDLVKEFLDKKNKHKIWSV